MPLPGIPGTFSWTPCEPAPAPVPDPSSSGSGSSSDPSSSSGCDKESTTTTEVSQMEDALNDCIRQCHKRFPGPATDVPGNDGEHPSGTDPGADPEGGEEWPETATTTNPNANGSGDCGSRCDAFKSMMEQTGCQGVVSRNASPGSGNCSAGVVPTGEISSWEGGGVTHPDPEETAPPFDPDMTVDGDLCEWMGVVCPDTSGANPACTNPTGVNPHGGGGTDCGGRCETFGQTMEHGGCPGVVSCKGIHPP